MWRYQETKLLMDAYVFFLKNRGAHKRKRNKSRGKCQACCNLYFHLGATNARVFDKGV
jgi:hypothetical protein